MEYALEERIGDPVLFTGRNEELAYFLNWINDIKERKSQSTAVLARRKMGKTALMERLFNITFHKNDGVIPFYYEIKESKMWTGDFCVDFFLTFIYQYIAFKSRKVNYLGPDKMNSLEEAKQAAINEGLDYLTGIIKNVEYAVNHDHVDLLWETVRQAPKSIAFSQKEFIVQMIDEFRLLNRMIYRDKKFEVQAETMAGGYLSSAESKVAPLLVSGSWVGWLMNQLVTMLPARFKYNYLENMPEEEAVEMVYKYSRFFDVPVTEETVYLMTQLAEGSPFYTSSIIRSSYRHKDLRTLKGLKETLEFETLNDHGTIKSTWMEYVSEAFKQVNGKNAKKIVLYLCQNREREVTRKELLEKLPLNMDDAELEEKLKALVKADIIKQGRSNFDYQGVQDNIFDKVFRGVYEREIHEFDVSVIGKEYYEAFEKLKKQYNSLQGKYNYQQGYFAEYVILDQLKFHAVEKNELLKSITNNLPGDFDFCDYSRVWRYDSSPEYKKSFSMDIFAPAHNPGDYSIIGEVKSREVKKFSKDEVVTFEKKFNDIKKIENINRALGFIFSRNGFTKEAEEYCQEKGFAFSQDKRWLEE